jgi:hypothetical protein
MEEGSRVEVTTTKRKIEALPLSVPVQSLSFLFMHSKLSKSPLEYQIILFLNLLFYLVFNILIYLSEL